MNEGDFSRKGNRSGLRTLAAFPIRPAAWILPVDVLAVLVAASLPWSTSAVAILMVMLLLALLPTIDLRLFLRGLARPASALPLIFFALALLGTLWADSPWAARMHGINPVAKFVAIPFLLYHFERSRRGAWVFVAFLISCTLLMTLSWIVLFVPELKVTATASDGVPVKNYIDQSQEFALCTFALAPIVLRMIQARRFAVALGCGILIAGFFANMMFVVSARTALIYMPVMLVLFGVTYLGRRAIALMFSTSIVVALLIWFASPYLRNRIADIGVEYQYYRQNIPRSTGQRIEYWRKSLKFVSAAPLFGNGTGSTKQLFERDAVGQVGLSAEVIGNPHNQTLNVAVQWGLLGIVVLYAMWFCHLGLFREAVLPAWIGLLIVAQNVVSSLLNSHLFDFHEGWMYVLGVGVAGGMMMNSRSRQLRVPSESSSVS